MLKTSFMQRVGGTEGKLVPPEFTELAGKVKSLKLLLAEMIDRVKLLNKSILGTSSEPFSCVCVLSFGVRLAFRDSRVCLCAIDAFMTCELRCSTHAHPNFCDRMRMKPY